jgi:hypothetical protein
MLHRLLHLRVIFLTFLVFLLLFITPGDGSFASSALAQAARITFVRLPGRPASVESVGMRFITRIQKQVSAIPFLSGRSAL